MAQPGDGVYIPQHGEADPIKLAREALNRWQNTGCPDCRGDCGSANPPVNCCIMIETRDALAALDAIPQPAPVPGDAELDALDRQADLIRNMLHMGEKIAWGADTGVIDQQRAALSALRTRLAEVEGAQTDAARDVLAERARQIGVEGRTPEHDDQYSQSELARAAGCYALASAYYHADPQEAVASIWPWFRASLKPVNPRRDLVKAGALILAEIERLDRAALSQPTQEQPHD